jgi:hypothetical protein
MDDFNTQVMRKFDLGLTAKVMKKSLSLAVTLSLADGLSPQHVHNELSFGMKFENFTN